MVNTAPPDSFSEVGENVAWEVSEFKTVYGKTKQLLITPDNAGFDVVTLFANVAVSAKPISATRVLTTNLTPEAVPPVSVTAP